MTITSASRVVRSEIVKLAAINQRFANAVAPARDMMAAAYKYRVEVSNRTHAIHLIRSTHQPAPCAGCYPKRGGRPRHPWFLISGRRLSGRAKDRNQSVLEETTPQSRPIENDSMSS